MNAIANPLRPYSTSPLALFGTVWRNRELIIQLASREVLSRYRGSILGLAWSFFNPLLMLGVYTFVFSVVFKARWGVGGEESKAAFAIIMFVGMIIHGFFAECLNRAPTLILSNVNYVKKVVFPLEILPWVAAGSALFHAVISLAVLLTAQLVFQHTLAWTVVLLPILFTPLFLGTIGVAWFLASIGVYMRDINQTIGILTSVLLFLSPVFYPVHALPEEFRILFLLNPLTFFIEDARRILIWGEMPDWSTVAAYTLGSLVVAWLGFGWFQRTRRGFADVV